MLPEPAYKSLLDNIGQTFTAARTRVYAAVNQQLLEAYWNIGRQIAEYELQGKSKADYGSDLYRRLSKDLTIKYGKGFGRTNVYLMRQFFETYPIVQSLTGRLTWTHYAEILGISDPLARSFYEKQCVSEGWSVRQLKRLSEQDLEGKFFAALGVFTKRILTTKSSASTHSAVHLVKTPSAA